MLMDDSEWQVYRDDQGATGLPRDMFYGPMAARRFIEKKTPTQRWPNDLECKGGALVDETRQVLLLFGGDAVQRKVGTHRCYLRMMPYSWPNWTVRWAYDKIGDLIDYLGLDRQPVRSGWKPALVDHLLLEAEVSPAPLFTFNQQIFYGDRRLDDWLLHGPGLIEDRDFPGGYREWRGDEIPLEGAHLDFQAKTLDFWSTDARMESVRCYQEIWPNWTITYHQDRFEDQLARNSSVSFPPIHWGWEFQNLRYQLGPGRFDTSREWVRQMKAREQAAGIWGQAGPDFEQEVQLLLSLNASDPVLLAPLLSRINSLRMTDGAGRGTGRQVGDIGVRRGILG